MTFCNDFRIHNLTNAIMILKPTKHVKWSKPPTGIIKINVDAAWDRCSSVIGILA